MRNKPQNSRTHWVTSPKAVSALLRGTSTDTRTCTNTTAHTIPVNLPDFRRDAEPTLRVYVDGGMTRALRK